MAIASLFFGRHLMIYLNPPNPLFKGAHQGLRAFHRLMAALPANSGPASDDALLLLLGMTTSVSGNFRHITDIISTKNLRIVNKRFKNRIKHLKIVKIFIGSVFLQVFRKNFAYYCSLD